MSHYQQDEEIPLESDKDTAQIQSEIENESEDLKSNEESKNIQEEVSPSINAKEDLKEMTKFINDPHSDESHKGKRFKSLVDTEHNLQTQAQKISKKNKLNQGLENEIGDENKETQSLIQNQLKETEPRLIIAQNQVQERTDLRYNNIELPKEEDVQNLFIKKQKAQLALKIYGLILKKPQQEVLKEKSLHNLIVELIVQKQNEIKKRKVPKMKLEFMAKIKEESSNQLTYEQKIISPFMNLFVNGFEIDTRIFSQERIVEGKFGQGPNQIFIFHPTFLITGQIFQELINLTNHKRVLTGHVGISKTVSVCLFWHLVKIIDEYRFQKNVQVSQQMIQVPKIIYWQIKNTLADNLDSLKIFIIEQCPQIKQYYKITDGGQYDWNLLIWDFYSRSLKKNLKFKVILVIDQINQSAKNGRTHQKVIEDINQRRKKGQIVNIQSISPTELASFLKMKDNVEFLIKHFNGILGLSSMNLQDLFFKQVKMTIFNNQRVAMTWVKFSQQFFTGFCLMELSGYFIFEMNQRIFKKLTKIIVTEDIQKEIQRQCYKYMLERVSSKQYFFLTFYNIRLFIRQQSLNIVSFQMPIQQLKDQILLLFKNLVDNSPIQYKQILKGHFKKSDSNDDKRIKLMLSLYNYLISKAKDSNANQNPISSIPYQALKLKKQQIDKFIDKRLFQCLQKVIKLMLPIQFLIYLMEPSVKLELTLNAEVILQFIKNSSNQSQIGTMIEKQFIHALNQGNTKFSFQFQYQEPQKPITRYKFDIKKEVYTFEHLQQTFKNIQLKTKGKKKQENPQDNTNQILENKINQQMGLSIDQKQPTKMIKSQKPIYFLKRFIENIKLIISNSSISAVLFPVKKNFENKNPQKPFDPRYIVPNSKLIDLVMIQNYDMRKKNFISIWLIDVTTSKDKIRTKIKDFISQFLQFADKNVTRLTQIQNQPQVQINYIVFGPKAEIYHNHFLNQLNSNYGNRIAFKSYSKSNIFTVDKLQNSQNSLLKRVGYLNLGQDFKFDVLNQKSQKYLQNLNGLIKKI